MMDGNIIKKMIITTINSILEVVLIVIIYTFDDRKILFVLLMLAPCCQVIGYSIIDYKYKKELEKNHKSKDLSTGDMYKTAYDAFQVEFELLPGRTHEKEYIEKFYEGYIWKTVNIIMVIWNIIMVAIILCYWQ